MPPDKDSRARVREMPRDIPARIQVAGLFIVQTKSDAQIEHVRLVHERESIRAQTAREVERLKANLEALRLLATTTPLRRGDSEQAIPAVPIAAVVPVLLVPPRLTPREKQLLKLAMQAEPIKEMAVLLNLTPATVSQYLKGLYRKFNVHSKGELAIYGWQDEQGDHKL